MRNDFVKTSGKLLNWKKQALFYQELLSVKHFLLFSGFL